MLQKILKFLLNKKDKPETSLVFSFALVILIGTFLLMLPYSTVDGEGASFLTSLFTSTSATCVTGLIVVDTGNYFSMFGQIVILILIQAGGIGIMTFTALFAWLAGKKLSVLFHYNIADSFVLKNESISLQKTIVFIFISTFIIEFLGAILLFFPFHNKLETWNAVYNAIFHSISAYCNAGFSLNNDSLISFHNSPVVLFTIIALIIAGGLGYPVLMELKTWAKSMKTHKFSLHLKIVFISSLFLIILGAILINFGDKGVNLLDSVFQSVSTRTAGFNSIDFSSLSSPALFAMIMLMFIGGSPGSTAGGVKTTTFAGAIVIVKDLVFGKTRKRTFKRRLAEASVRKIKVVIILAISVNLLSFFILLYTEYHFKTGLSFRNILFEVVSALGTVGLSTGITTKLSVLGKYIIIMDMFIGRLGPLALVTAILFTGEKTVKIDYPEEKILIG